MTIKTLFATTALALTAAAAPLAAQASFGPTTLEVASTSQEGLRTRLFLNGEVSLLGAKLDYVGLHETTNGNAAQYGGRNMFTANLGSDNLQPTVALPTNKDGVSTAWYGVRNLSIMKAIGSPYGWIDLVAGKKGVQSLVFYERSAGAFHGYAMTMPTWKHDGSTADYNEIQLERILAKNDGHNVKAFARTEFGTGQKPLYLAGARAQW